MATISIEIDAGEVSVNPGTRRSVIINFSAEKSDVLNHFDVQAILEHFDHDELLESIGMDAALKHFGLEGADV